MATPRRPLPSRRRAILVYLLAIVVPTLVLLSLGVQSVRRQREAISSLTASNLRLSGERLAAELEQHVTQLAEACLRDGELVRLSNLPDTNTPEAARRVRMALSKVRERHPVAHYLFLMESSTVLFPLLRTPPPRRLDRDLSGQEPGVRQRFAALLGEAENQELRQQRLDLALATYRQIYELPVSDPLKALSLARLARCLRKTNQPAAAQQVYRMLAERFGDVYDAFYRPYALVAGLEVGSPELVSRLYKDMVRGRWELSAEQLDYFLGRYRERLKEPADLSSETNYLNSFKLARALEERFRHQGPVRPGEAYAYAFTQGDGNYQTCYTLLGAEEGKGILLGLAVDLNWVEKQLLPQCRRELGIDQRDATLKLARKVATSGTILQANVSFKNLFPFWELSLASGSSAVTAASLRRDTLVFAGSTALVLGVLVLGVVLLMRDVSREMELSRLRADFVSGVSHELKTPLTLIRLYGETLLHGEDFQKSERKSYYEIITRESERLTHLIEKVLDFSRIDRGRKQYHLEEGDLAPIVSRTVDLYEQYLKRRGFSVEADLAASLPPVRFDSEAVSQAVLNLLDNAAKYTGESKFVGIRLYGEDNKVTFEVEDHGPGIPAGEHEKIFQQFYRAPGVSGKGGYGLGLFLVKHIMDAHTGSVELQSEVGRGSHFRLIFPCTKS